MAACGVVMPVVLPRLPVADDFLMPHGATQEHQTQVFGGQVQFIQVIIKPGTVT